jgi:hypothetical protein
MSELTLYVDLLNVNKFPAQSVSQLTRNAELETRNIAQKKWLPFKGQRDR